MRDTSLNVIEHLKFEHESFQVSSHASAQIAWTYTALQNVSIMNKILLTTPPRSTKLCNLLSPLRPYSDGRNISSRQGCFDTTIGVKTAPAGREQE